MLAWDHWSTDLSGHAAERSVKARWTGACDSARSQAARRIAAFTDGTGIEHLKDPAFQAPQLIRLAL